MRREAWAGRSVGALARWWAVACAGGPVSRQMGGRVGGRVGERVGGWLGCADRWDGREAGASLDAAQNPATGILSYESARTPTDQAP